MRKGISLMCVIMAALCLGVAIVEGNLPAIGGWISAIAAWGLHFRGAEND